MRILQDGYLLSNKQLNYFCYSLWLVHQYLTCVIRFLIRQTKFLTQFFNNFQQLVEFIFFISKGRSKINFIQKTSSQTEQKKFCLESTIKRNQITDLKVYIWDSFNKRLQNGKIQITINHDNLIIYSYQNSILRKEQLKDSQDDLYLYSNVEKVKCLNWLGEYRENNKKQGFWIANWSGELLQNLSGYYEDGIKKGLWNELSKNYCSQFNLNESGEYLKNKKIGKWKYLHNMNEIGGGRYDGEGDGLKIGKWIDLDDRYYINSEIIYKGEYQNGKKTGLWGIWYKNEDDVPFKQIGGGLYDEQNKGIKNGKWIELDDEFYSSKQVTQRGEYKYGKKVGIWDAWYKEPNGENQKIGGGLYDNENDDKIGKWIDLDEGFYQLKQVIYCGEYKNGKKVDGWDIYYRHEDYKDFQYIGGGLYDNENDNIKIGNWIDLDEGFYYLKSVTYSGEYKNGKKVGRWDIRWIYDEQNKEIGGGQYNDGLKTGYWIDLDEGFDIETQLTYGGLYVNGKKVGRWDICFKELDGDYQQMQNLQFKVLNNVKCISGGGSYEEGTWEIKIGDWIDLDEGFILNKQVTYCGEYEYDKKVGRWDTWYKEQNGDNEKIGGGSYDEENYGIKIGKWIDLDEEFQSSKQVIFIGEYKNGKKVGRWNIWYRHENQRNFQEIGGGLYDEQNNGIKIGKWIDLDEEFYDEKQVIFIGEYKNGKKVGKWEIESRYSNNNPFSKIGGGTYDEGSDCMKIGKWIDISERFYEYCQVIYKGEYKNGKRVGIWNIEFRKYGEEHFQYLGGGSYDNENCGIKIGKWTDLDEEFEEFNQVIYNGEYKNGKKIGTWKRMKRNENQIEEGFKNIVELQYDN